MTDKKVIKLAQELITDFKCESDTMVDFCNTVIKKFEQEPCEDCIKREPIQKAIKDMLGWINSGNRGNADYFIVDQIEEIIAELDIDNLPSAIPQPFINKPCISEGVCREDKIQVLDKLRAEIENHCGFAKENHCEYCYSCPNLMGVKEILEVIDKYRTESEVKADGERDSN